MASKIDDAVGDGVGVDAVGMAQKSMQGEVRRKKAQEKPPFLPRSKIGRPKSWEVGWGNAAYFIFTSSATGKCTDLMYSNIFLPQFSLSMKSLGRLPLEF